MPAHAKSPEVTALLQEIEQARLDTRKIAESINDAFHAGDVRRAMTLTGEIERARERVTRANSQLDAKHRID